MRQPNDTINSCLYYSKKKKQRQHAIIETVQSFMIHNRATIGL